MVTGAQNVATAVVHTMRMHPGGINGLGATPIATTLTIRAGGPYVAGLGDTNNDGYGDLMWSSTNVSVRVHQGTSTGFNAAASVTFTPASGDSDYGWALWHAGDLNGDNLWDLLYEHTNTSPCRRVIKAHHATATTFPLTPATTIYLPLTCIF